MLELDMRIGTAPDKLDNDAEGRTEGVMLVDDNIKIHAKVACHGCGSDSDQNSMIDHFRLIGWLENYQFFFSIMEFRSSIFNHSVLEWSNDRFFSIKKNFFLPMNMPSGNMQHWKSQKKNFTLVFLFIFCYRYWLYHLIDFLRQIDWFFQTDWSINQFFNFFQPINQIFWFFKMIDHRLKLIKKWSMIGTTRVWRVK